MTRPDASEIADRLANQIDSLVGELLPAGHREGAEWRCGSVEGEPGNSLGVHLTGSKSGIWRDFAADQSGDALDLVKAVCRLDTREALAWSRCWLGIDDGKAVVPRRPRLSHSKKPNQPASDAWVRAWNAAKRIRGTLAQTYLAARHLQFDDPDGRVLRFHQRRARKNPADDEFEHHPALLALLRDIRTGQACGVINIYLQPDGRDRIKDRKAKTVTGRVGGAAVMLSAFDTVTMGLSGCEGVETGIAILMGGFAPVWALGGAGNLGSFPVLGGIECLTVAADNDHAGQIAAHKVAEQWQVAGREASIITPPAGDWADPQ